MHIPKWNPVSNTFPSPVVFPTETTVSVSPADKLAEELKNSYQNIHFDFIDFKSNDQIKDYASSQKGMNNVVISKTLLENMAVDEELLKKVKHLLDSFSKYQHSSVIEAHLANKELIGMGLIIDENGNVSKWTKAEKMPENQFFIPEDSSSDVSYLFSTSENKKKESFSIPYKYSHSRHMIRLANAKNVAAVRGLIASGYSEIGKVKLKVTDPKEAASIIRKIKSVIRNGNIKIARLHKEEQLFRNERIAAKRQKAKLERQLAEQLRKKKIARKAQEHCQTASFDDIFVKPSINDERYRQISGQYLSVSDMAGTIPTSAMMTSSAVSAAPSVSVDVCVSSVTTIDCSV